MLSRSEPKGHPDAKRAKNAVTIELGKANTASETARVRALSPAQTIGQRKADLAILKSAPPELLPSLPAQEVDAGPGEIFRRDPDLLTVIWRLSDSVSNPEIGGYGDTSPLRVSERIHGSQAARVVEADTFRKGSNPVMGRGIHDVQHLDANVDGTPATVAGHYGNGQYFGELANARSRSDARSNASGPDGHLYAAKLTDDAVVVDYREIEDRLIPRTMESDDIPQSVKDWVQEDALGRTALLAGVDAIRVKGAGHVVARRSLQAENSIAA